MTRKYLADVSMAVPLDDGRWAEGTQLLVGLAHLVAVVPASKHCSYEGREIEYYLSEIHLSTGVIFTVWADVEDIRRIIFDECIDDYNQFPVQEVSEWHPSS